MALPVNCLCANYKKKCKYYEQKISIQAQNHKGNAPKRIRFLLTHRENRVIYLCLK